MVFSIRTIHEIKEKVKRGVGTAKNLLGKEDIFIVAVVVLVGFGGFGLGRLSRVHDEKIPVVINGAPAFATAPAGGARTLKKIDTQTQTGKNFVASVSGTKYHLPWCFGASAIKEANKIWFATEDEARAAGYGPAGNCKGL